MNAIAIIPARYASTRFPGKPLIDIAGKSMIQRVYERTSQAKSIQSVVVATDDQRIAAHVQEFGGRVIMTSESHTSGTDRCAEAASHFDDADIVVNIQGDEPFIQAGQIDLLTACFKDDSVNIATLIKKVDDAEDLFNHNIPKVTVTKGMKALYFSRSTIPYLRDAEQSSWLDKHLYFKHIGIYAFRRSTLMQLTELPPSPLELAESLEQLRWLEHGYKIQTAETPYQSHGIDVPDDVERVIALFKDDL